MSTPKALMLVSTIVQETVHLRAALTNASSTRTRAAVMDRPDVEDAHLPGAPFTRTILSRLDWGLMWFSTSEGISLTQENLYLSPEYIHIAK
jgi:hypothetical protein